MPRYQLYSLDADHRVVHCAPRDLPRLTRYQVCKAEAAWRLWRDGYLAANPGRYPLRETPVVTSIWGCPIEEPQAGQRFDRVTTAVDALYAELQRQQQPAELGYADDDEEERRRLGNLLRSHPRFGKSALTIEQCLRHRSIPRPIKRSYVEFMQQRYPTSHFSFPEV